MVPTLTLLGTTGHAASEGTSDPQHGWTLVQVLTVSTVSLATFLSVAAGLCKARFLRLLRMFCVKIRVQQALGMAASTLIP